MRKLKFAFFILLIIPFTLRAQNNTELGFFGGTSQYMGDINKEKLFYAPSFSAGAFYRYILNPRYSIKGGVTWGVKKKTKASTSKGLAK